MAEILSIHAIDRNLLIVFRTCDSDHSFSHLNHYWSDRNLGDVRLDAFCLGIHRYPAERSVSNVRIFESSLGGIDADIICRRERHLGFVILTDIRIGNLADKFHTIRLAAERQFAVLITDGGRGAFGGLGCVFVEGDDTPKSVPGIYRPVIFDSTGRYMQRRIFDK